MTTPARVPNAERRRSGMSLPVAGAAFATHEHNSDGTLKGSDAEKEQ